jgi:hypothetical protein
MPGLIVLIRAPGPTWGYHFQDINLSLGNLVNDVHAAEHAFSS